MGAKFCFFLNKTPLSRWEQKNQSCTQTQTQYLHTPTHSGREDSISHGQALQVNVHQEILTNRHWLGTWESTLFSQLKKLFFSDYSCTLLQNQKNIKLINYIGPLLSPSVIAFSYFTCTENGVLDYKWTVFCVTTLVKYNKIITYWNITEKENEILKRPACFFSYSCCRCNFLRIVLLSGLQRVAFLLIHVSVYALFLFSKPISLCNKVFHPCRDKDFHIKS